MAQPEKAEPKLRVAEEPVSVETSDETASTRFLEPLIILARRKSFILRFVGIAAVLSIVVSSPWPKSSTATSKIMPRQQSQSMNMTAMLARLVALAGGDAGLLRNPSDFCFGIMQSRILADALIESSPRVGGSALSSLPAGTLSFDFGADLDPQRAADRADAYVCSPAVERIATTSVLGAV